MYPMPRFPPPGSRGPSSPVSAVLSRHCDFLTPVPPHFVAFAWRYHQSTRLLSSLPPLPSDGGRPGVGLPVSPSGSLVVETSGSPKFLGNPHSRLLVFSDPGRPTRSRPIAERSHGPPYQQQEDADNNCLSRLNSTAFGIAAYVSRWRLPALAQGLLPGAGQALPDGLLPARFL
jgi:hypothetical protein